MRPIVYPAVRSKSVLRFLARPFQLALEQVDSQTFNMRVAKATTCPVKSELKWDEVNWAETSARSTNTFFWNGSDFQEENKLFWDMVCLKIFLDARYRVWDIFHCFYSIPHEIRTNSLVLHFQKSSLSSRGCRPALCSCFLFSTLLYRCYFGSRLLYLTDWEDLVNWGFRIQRITRSWSTSRHLYCHPFH